METLSVHNLSYAFTAQKPVLKDISFSLEKGKITLLAGPNGSGKSVLLKNIKGLYSPKQGKIVINGKDLTKKRKARLREVGLVFQNASSQVVGSTVESDIRFGMENLGLDRDSQNERLEETLRITDLQHKRHDAPSTLSGGELKRLAIAGVLVMKPSLLIMDEPFANLDWRGVRKLLKTMLALREDGTTLMIVTHEVEKILAHTDRIIILDNGEIAEQGTKEKMLPLFRQHDIYLPPHAKAEDLTWL